MVRMEARGCKLREEGVSTGSTENDHDGMGTNMRPEEFVGILHRPKFPSFREYMLGVGPKG